MIAIPDLPFLPFRLARAIIAQMRVGESRFCRTAYLRTFRLAARYQHAAIGATHCFLDGRPMHKITRIK